jgi:hypothetical protein
MRPGRRRQELQECWSAGVLECWSDGVLEYWSDGVLEFRSTHCGARVKI